MSSPEDTDSGRGGLRGRLPPIPLPRDLDTRVRASLAARGLISTTGIGGSGSGTRRDSAAWIRRVGLLAAGIVLGVVATSLFRGANTRPPDISAAGQYVILLYGDTPGDTGAVHVAREREYGRWASSLTSARWVGGHELADVVDRAGPSGDSAAAEGRLAGYFVIEAPSRERAAEVARTCPHLKYGGRVVVMAVAG
jgi:hypothetical protein